MARFRRLVVAAASAILLSSLAAPALAEESDDVTTELSALNSEFREWYGARRAEILAAQPLILVVNNAGVTAIQDGDSATYSVDLTAYTQVKSILHAVLGYQGLMRSMIAAGPSADWTQVDDLVTSLRAARSLIPATELPAHHQRQVIAGYDTLISSAERARAQESITLSDQRAALRSARGLLYPSVLWVGRQHARNMRSVLQTVKADVSPHAWNRAVAVVTGPMTPRRNNLETAVTAKMLGPDKLGHRIFYSENLFTTKDALGYLGTVLSDSQFSKDMFDSWTRMWQDLFADVSSDYVARDFYTALATTGRTG